MPELPEVETVKRLIEPQIVGRHILQGIALHPQVIACLLYTSDAADD